MKRFSCYINTFWVLCIVQLGVSIALIFEAVEVITITEGHFIGAVYAGCIGIVTSIVGLAVPVPWYQWNTTIGFFTFFHGANFGTLICAVVGAAITNQTIAALKDLNSCAYYSPGESTCTATSDVEDIACIGDSSSYRVAESCTKDSPIENTCYCTFFNIKSYQCTIFAHIPSCHELMFRYPTLLNECLALIIVILVISILQMVFFRNLRLFKSSSRRRCSPIVQEVEADSLPAVDVVAVASITLQSDQQYEGYEMIQAEALPVSTAVGFKAIEMEIVQIV